MGAVDVVPFIPVRGMEIAEAVETARAVRALYRRAGRAGLLLRGGGACDRSARSLPDIRKGQYEALEAKLKDPAWAPDEGPAVFNARSGAVVTGVRFPLVAFNVNLRTTDVAIAEPSPERCGTSTAGSATCGRWAWRWRKKAWCRCR